MNDFQQYLVEEFAEDYQEGRLNRRDALKLIASVTGSLLAANTILAGCAPAPVETAPASADTPGAASTLAAAPATQPAVASSPTAGLPPTSRPTPSPFAQATAGAESSTPAASPSPAAGEVYGTVSPDDPQVWAEAVQFAGEDGATLMGYLARPSGEGASPVILVCHENRGLTEHIQDVTRRLAKAGYVALAVDLLSRQGGTTAVGSDNVPGALGNMPQEQFVQDFLSGWKSLQGKAFAQTEKVGMVGFCFGGGVTWRVATRMPELRAGVPFYGPPPPVTDVPGIQAAVLAIYAGRDQRINASIPDIEAAMKANGKIYEKVIYPDVDHAFHNDTGPRYNPEAAKDAWARTLAWFEKYVKGR